jgi:hypothetical protein
MFVRDDNANAVYHEGNEKHIQHKLPPKHIGDAMSI